MFASLLHTHTHVKKILIITGVVVFVILCGAAGIAFGHTNYEAEIGAQLARSKAAREQARTLSCAHIGQLTASCYARDAGSCGRLADAEQAYQDEFGSSAVVDCFSEAPGDLHPIVTDPEDNPLFFGDEGASR